MLFIISLSEILIIMLGAYILSNKVITKKQILTMTGVGSVIGYLLFLMFGVIAFPVMIILGAIYLYFKMDRSWKSLLWILNAVIISVIGSFLVYPIMLGLYNNSIIPAKDGYWYDTIYSIGMLIFTVATCLGLRYILTKFNVKQLIDKKYLPFLVFGSLAVISSLYLNIFILQGMEIEFNDSLALLLVFALYALVLLILLFFVVKITTDKIAIQSERMQAKQLNEYTEKLEKQHKAITKIRHDYINILISMTGYVDNNDIQGLKRYIKKEVLPAERQIYADEKQIALLLNLNILPIKGLLASKLGLAQLSGIKVTVEIPNIIDKWQAKDYDMSRIMGIILDNAIEECECCEAPEINIGIFTTETDYVIVVENSCRAKTPHPNQLQIEGFSTKGNSRGLGLSNLAEIVVKSGCVLLETSVDNQVFAQKLTIARGNDND